MENTVNPKTAVNQGRLARLAKLVDQITLSRSMLCRLRNLGMGIEEVEHQARKWALVQDNGLGEFCKERENTEGVNSSGKTSARGKGRGRKGRKGEPMERDLKKIRDLMDLKVKQVMEKEK